LHQHIIMECQDNRQQKKLWHPPRIIFDVYLEKQLLHRSNKSQSITYAVGKPFDLSLHARWHTCIGILERKQFFDNSCWIEIGLLRTCCIIIPVIWLSPIMYIFSNLFNTPQPLSISSSPPSRSSLSLLPCSNAYCCR